MQAFCRSSENCKSLVLQDKCNIEIFLFLQTFKTNMPFLHLMASLLAIPGFRTETESLSYRIPEKGTSLSKEGPRPFQSDKIPSCLRVSLVNF